MRRALGILLAVMLCTAALPAAAAPLFQGVAERSNREDFGWKNGVMTRLLGNRRTRANSAGNTSLDGLVVSSAVIEMLNDSETLILGLDDPIGTLLKESVSESLPHNSALDDSLSGEPASTVSPSEPVP